MWFGLFVINITYTVYVQSILLPGLSAVTTNRETFLFPFYYIPLPALLKNYGVRLLLISANLNISKCASVK